MNRQAVVAALRNLAWILGDKAFAMAAGLLIFGMIGRAFGPEGAGHFAYAAALLQVGLGLALVCSASALLPRFCRMHAALPGALANVFVVRMAASLLALAVMAAFTALTVTDPVRRDVTLVVLLAIPLIEPFMVISTYWSSRNHNQPNVVARTTGLLVRLLVLAAGIAAGAAPVLLAATWVLEAVVNAAIQWRQLRRALPGRRFVRFVRWRRARGYLRYGARFMLGSWLHVLYTRLDRLLLGERLPHDTFGLYATAMQLVDTWVQVANLVGLSVATAYLYKRIRAGAFARAFLLSAAGMACIGLVGLAGAWLLGPWIMRAVFGPAFAGSQPYLVAGMALGLLLFANQIVLLTLATLNRPLHLVVMWSVAVAVATPLVWLGVDRVGPVSGPLGLGAGLVAGWVVLAIMSLRAAR